MNSGNKLAVCMPAFNAEKHIAKAIGSILSQTYTDYLFIITDDCSTDSTVSVIESFDDPRIILRKNLQNKGTVPNRNEMLRYCIDHGYTYMAVMDADDIAFPDRLKKQIEILDKDQSLAVCGSSMEVERTNRIWVAPQHPGSIKVECIFGNPIPTSTAMLRLRFLEQYNLQWNKEFVPCADYHLWYVMLYKYNLRAKNTGDVDMIYTYSPAGVSHNDGLMRQERRDAEVKRLILDCFSVEAKPEELVSFMKVALYRSENKDDAMGFLNISRQLLGNNRNLIVNQDDLVRKISHRATSYVGKTIGLSDEIEKSIRDELVVRKSYLVIRIERYLKRFKQKILDRYFPSIGDRFSSLYFLVKNKISGSKPDND